MAERNPTLVIVAGANGFSKTTITTALQKAYDWTSGLVEINPKQIAQEEFRDWNDPSSILKGANRAEQVREECLTARKGLFFKIVLSTPEKVDYIRRAKEAGYFMRLVYVGTASPAINILRVEWRFSQGGHSVPREKIEPDTFVRSNLPWMSPALPTVPISWITGKMLMRQKVRLTHSPFSARQRA